MIAGSKTAAKIEQEAKKVREADPFDVFQDIIHISPAQPVLFEGGSFCILLSDEESLSLTFEETPSKKTYREEVHSKASGEKTYSGELLTFYADDRFTVSSESSFGLLRLRPEAVLSLTGRIRLFRNILSDYNAAAILHIRQGFEELLDMTEGSSFVSGRLGKTSCVLRILQLLIDAGLPHESVPEPLVPLSPRRLALYRSLAACIRERGTNRIHQAEAAELLGITPQYLGHPEMKFRRCPHIPEMKFRRCPHIRIGEETVLLPDQKLRPSAVQACTQRSIRFMNCPCSSAG